jgi:heptosyltransferase-2
MRRLVRLPNHLGDACMALPAITRLAQSGEGLAGLVVAGRPWAPDLLAGTSWPAAALPTPRLARIRALRSIARGRPIRDALLLTNSFSSALEMRLAGIAPAGYATDGRSWLLREAHRVPDAWPAGAMHTSAYYWFLAGRSLGLPEAQAAAGMPAPVLPLGPAARDHAAQALAAAGIRPSTAGNPGYVVICPAAVGLHRGRVKRWDGFATLCGRLAREGVRVVTCPGPGEREAVREAAPAATIVGPLDVLSFAALLAASRLVVANDSGASHLAAAAGARLLTVFGVTNPARTAPCGARATWIGSESAWPDYGEVESAALRLLAEPGIPSA